MFSTSLKVRHPLLNSRFSLKKMIGKGGFGETFLAEDTHYPIDESFRQCVVKKLVPRSGSDPNQVRKLFNREKKALHHLGKHPQIPELYAAFEENGRFYVVQEWIEGHTLAQTVSDRKRPTEQQVKSWMKALLPVLEHIHKQNIIHLDIKPENIIVRRNSNSQPVLIDFGAVKEIMRTGTQSLNHRPKSSIGIIGTKGYAPPEQWEGTVKPGNDLYSLAMTAIHLLTGIEPYQLYRNERGRLHWRHYTEGVSNEFQNFLDYAVELAPYHRFTAASEMMTSLQAEIQREGRPYSSVRSTFWYPHQNPHTYPFHPLNIGRTRRLSSITSVCQTLGIKSKFKNTFLGISLGSCLVIGGLILIDTQNITVDNLDTLPVPEFAKGIIESISSPEKKSPTQSGSRQTAKSENTESAKPDTSRRPRSPQTPDNRQENPPADTQSNPKETASSTALSPSELSGTISGTLPERKFVRKEPNSNSEVVGHVWLGDRVRVTDQAFDSTNYPWRKIATSDGIEGYVAEHLITLDKTSSNQSNAGTGEPEKPSSKGTPATIAGETGGKNIRSGPGTNNRVIHTAPVGSRILIHGTSQDDNGYQWYKVSVPGTDLTEGWILKDLVELK
ncbi:MAG: serine/threonine protein kinase [Cyanobacteria bacterium J06626_6]